MYYLHNKLLYDTNSPEYERHIENEDWTPFSDPGHNQSEGNQGVEERNGERRK